VGAQTRPTRVRLGDERDASDRAVKGLELDQFADASAYGLLTGQERRPKYVHAFTGVGSQRAKILRRVEPQHRAAYAGRSCGGRVGGKGTDFLCQPFVPANHTETVRLAEPPDGSVCHDISPHSSRTGEEGAGAQTELALMSNDRSRLGSPLPIPAPALCDDA
jgi:hypothetical protein